MIRVLVADDHALVRDGLAALLRMSGHMTVVTVGDGRAALAAVRDSPFDVVVLDVRMPVMDGVACTRALRDDGSEVPILMLTTFDDRDLVHASLEAGAQAYMLKDVDPADLLTAIRLLAAGESLVPGDVARDLLSADRVGPRQRQPSVGSTVGLDALTPRQFEVLALIAEGCSNREIAARLRLGDGTVKNVVSEIYGRLNVRDRVQAVLAFARSSADVDREGSP